MKSPASPSSSLRCLSMWLTAAGNCRPVDEDSCIANPDPDWNLGVPDGTKMFLGGPCEFVPESYCYTDADGAYRTVPLLKMRNGKLEITFSEYYI